ncbi:MAG: PLP-dependent aminotransferase family protein [Planctomycetota bacterium]|nr:PLP-dependent aminotransferase family protein [Planctomycetota bacterium]
MQEPTEPEFQPSQRAQQAAGQPIAALMDQALARPDLISLAAGFVDQASLPVEPTRTALDALMTEHGSALAALQYGPSDGDRQLRTMLFERLEQTDFGGRAKTISPDHMLITPGSNQLLYLISDTILDPGDIVLCAAPTYFVFLSILKNLGARAIGIDSDGEGMIPDALLAVLRELQNSGEIERVKAIYLTPYFDNPRGVTMPLHRREAIVTIAQEWSRKRPLYVLADNAYRELRYDSDDVPSLLTLDHYQHTVVEIGTFSKSFSPGLRVGWGVLPPALLQPVQSQKGNLDFGSPYFSQRIMAKILELQLYDRHIATIRECYQTKRNAMCAALEDVFPGDSEIRWQRPHGGLYVWIELPEHLAAGPSGRLLKTTLDEGTFYVPGEYCFPSEGTLPRKNTLRLSFGVQPPEQLHRGVAALGRALDKCL